MLVWLFFLYSCCWQVLFQGTCFPFLAGCRMRLLRDVNRKPRDLLWQPDLKYIRTFFFISRDPCTPVEGLVLLHSCWAPQFQGFQVTLLPEKLPLCLCRSGGAQQVLVHCCLPLQVLPVVGTTALDPLKASAQPMQGRSGVSYYCQGFYSFLWLFTGETSVS